MFLWLFLSLAGVLGLRIVSDNATGLADYALKNPWLIFVGACALLWFPVASAITWSDISIIAAYLRQVSFPRIESLAEERRRLAGASGPDSPLQPPISSCEGLYSWEEFRSGEVYRQGMRSLHLTSLYLVRSALLYVPTLLVFACALFIQASRGFFLSDPFEFWASLLPEALWIIAFTALILAYLYPMSNLNLLHNGVLQTRKMLPENARSFRWKSHQRPQS
jgi:uncharacterized membrane protein